MVKNFTFTKAILFAFALSPATTLKSMLQQLDSQISTKDNFLHDQRSKLSEKEKVIINQRSELERLEKRSKTLEYKVLSHFHVYSFLHFVCFLCTNLSSSPLFRSTSCRRLRRCMNRTNAHLSRSWRRGSNGCTGSCQRGGAWSSACRAWSRTPSLSGRKSV